MKFARTIRRVRVSRRLGTLALLLAAVPAARAMEHITLRNGFELDCVRRVVDGDKVRLYLPPTAGASAESYLELPASSVLRVEIMPDPAAASRRTPPRRLRRPLCPQGTQAQVSLLLWS